MDKVTLHGIGVVIVIILFISGIWFLAYQSFSLDAKEICEGRGSELFELKYSTFEFICENKEIYDLNSCYKKAIPKVDENGNLLGLDKKWVCY